MPDISFDFQEYVALRKGADEAIARTGAAYAYPGDQKVLKTLGRVTPVVLAVEATVRLWKNVAKSEILGTSVKVTDRQFPAIYKIVEECASRLHIPAPTVYVAPQVDVLNAFTYGTDEDSYIVLNGVLVDHLTPEELRFVIGHECGHIQNNHVVYLTALHYLMYSANFFLRWIVTPALVALQSWTRRAEVTCDRAGLLCSGELAPSIAALAKLALGSQKLAEQLDVEEYLRQLEEGREGAGRILEIFRSHPYLPKRVAALKCFAQTHYFLKASGGDTGGGSLGQSLTWCDREVRNLLSIFGGPRAKKEE